MANKESSAEVSPKTKNGITTCLSNSTPGYKTKTLFQKDTCNPMFTAALFTVVKICKQLKCPSNEDVYIATMGYYSAIKKNEIVPFATTGMHLEGTVLSEMADRERQTLYDITYMWNLKNKTNW